MERFLRPERLETDPNSSTATKEFLHWYQTFRNFSRALQQSAKDISLLDLLTNYVAPQVFEYIAECKTYDGAIDTLHKLYVKPKNEIYARHVLATRRQETGETLDQYLQALNLLAKDCNFKAVTGAEARDEYVRDAFINGLSSPAIRQRLLENKTLDLQSAYEQAIGLEMAQKHSASYLQPAYSVNAVTQEPIKLEKESIPDTSGIKDTTANTACAAAPSLVKCYFCEFKRHPRSQCPAREAICLNCKKTGHYA